jgi:predicted alpha/beta hydrolase family esterase
MKESQLHKIANCDRADRIGDVIFVHGLMGDARGTWHPQGKKDDKQSWLFWLGQDLPDIGIWSIDYEVEPSAWLGNAMPLTDRATNILELLNVNDIGDRPIIFVTHSLGGLLVKQMFRTASDRQDKEWKNIVKKTRGIVFLATPHSGSNITNWVDYIGKILLRKTVSFEELKGSSPQLLDLNLWFRERFSDLNVDVGVYYEKEKLSFSKLFWIIRLPGIVIVGATSADPGIPGVKLTALDGNHITICRPDSKDRTVYLSVKRLIEKWFSTQLNNASSDSKSEQVQTENMQNVLYGNEGTQISNPQAPILKDIKDSSITFNYYDKPPN